MGFHHDGHGVGSAHDDLVQIIEGEIIPRLFLAHRHRAPHRLMGEAATLAENEFSALDFLEGDSARLTDQLQALLDRGVPRTQLYLDLLAPVPATLSRFWAEGHCSFDQVATGLCCIDEVLKQLHEREAVLEPA